MPNCDKEASILVIHVLVIRFVGSFFLLIEEFCCQVWLVLGLCQLASLRRLDLRGNKSFLAACGRHFELAECECELITWHFVFRGTTLWRHGEFSMSYGETKNVRKFCTFSVYRAVTQITRSVSLRKDWAHWCRDYIQQLSFRIFIFFSLFIIVLSSCPLLPPFFTS